MPKKLGIDPIYIAPKIKGQILENGDYYVYDELNGVNLNPNEAFDKIIIYERQVTYWFLNPAEKLVKYKNENKGFIVLMICLSYIEGVEEYKVGQESRGNGKAFFRNGIKRMYPDQFQEDQINKLYDQGRCGLFHSGMVRGAIVIDNSFDRSINFDQERIKISPAKFLRDIKIDFKSFIQKLRNDDEVREKFNRMYTNL